MNPALALAILLHASPDLNVTGHGGYSTGASAPVVVQQQPAPKPAAPTPTAPSNFNYGRADGQFPVLVELTGSVQVKK